MMGISLLLPERHELGELLDLAKREVVDDSVAMNEIIRRFEPLVVSLTRKIGSLMLRDDAANAARMALVLAVRQHRRSPDTFPGYAKVYMHGAVQREIASWAPPQPEVQLTTIPDYNPRASWIEERILTRLEPYGDGMLADLVETLSSSQREILDRRYLDDADLATIASELGTSVPAVSQRLQTIHRKIQAVLAA